MTTILKASTKQLKTMFEILTLSKSGEPVFNPIVFEVIEKDKNTYIEMQAVNLTYTIMTMQKHRNIEITHDGDPKVTANGIEIISALALFDNDAIIEIEFDGTNIYIRDTEDVDIRDEIKIPSPSIEGLNDYKMETPFTIDSNGIIELKNKKTGDILEFNINATIPINLIREQIKRANYAKIEPRLFKLEFNKNQLDLIVGDDSDTYSKSVKSTVEIKSKGEGTCTYGDGYESIFTSFDGDVIFISSNNSPAWITQKTDDHIVQFLLASAAA